MASWNSKRILDKNEGHLNKVWALAKNNASILLYCDNCDNDPHYSEILITGETGERYMGTFCTS